MKPSMQGAAVLSSVPENAQASMYDIQLLFEQLLITDSDLIRLHARLTAVGKRLRFAEVAIERLRLIAAEMATNQAKYARGHGLIQAWEIRVGTAYAVDLFALDYGPGIADIGQALQDGHSLGGTLGKGLGAIRRLAHEFGMVSRIEKSDALPWQGTAVWARIYATMVPKRGPWAIGAYRRAYQDARENGDGFVISLNNGLRVLHMDVVGHGEAAATVWAQVEKGWDRHRDIADALETLQSAPLMKRGAAVVCYEYNEQGHFRWGGVGDMVASLLSGVTNRHGLSLAPGILGQVHGHIAWATPSWPISGTVASASDGLRSHWPAALSLLGNAPPQLIAYVLGQVFGRLTDDRSCVIIRRIQ